MAVLFPADRAVWHMRNWVRRWDGLQRYGNCCFWQSFLSRVSVYPVACFQSKLLTVLDVAACKWQMQILFEIARRRGRGGHDGEACLAWCSLHVRWERLSLYSRLFLYRLYARQKTFIIVDQFTILVVAVCWYIFLLDSSLNKKCRLRDKSCVASCKPGNVHIYNCLKSVTSPY